MMDKKLAYATILIVLGILFRTVWHLGPNVEFVTTASLLAGAYLGKRLSVVVPLVIMVVTDIFIGNTNIYLFTWSAYIVIGVMGFFFLRNQRSNIPAKQDLAPRDKNQKRLAKPDPALQDRLKIKYNKILKATGVGITASIWFYLWTNFGVWLLDSWGMYHKTFSGLIEAYLMGLPFLKYQLWGNIVFVTLSFTIVEITSSSKISLVSTYRRHKLPARL